jgi:hypothetical protein
MRKTPLLAIALLALSCSHSASTTQPTTAPVTAPMEHVPVVLQLLARPSELLAQNPSDDPAQPKDIRLTLIVSNTTARPFSADSPDAAVAKFALTTLDGQPLWSYPNMASSVVTTVTLAPGQRAVYEAICRIPDIRPYKGKTLIAHASFSPTATNAAATITVK